jgi:hypothetical protein
MTSEEIIEGLKHGAATYLFESCLNRFFDKEEYVYSQPKYEAIMQVLNGILTHDNKNAVIADNTVDAIMSKMLDDWLNLPNNQKECDNHE